MDIVAPLAQVFAVRGGNERVARYDAELLRRVVGLAAFEQEPSVNVRLEACALTVVVEHILRTIVDRDLIHLYRSGVERRLCASPFAHRALYFGDGTHTHVELTTEIKILFHTGVGHTCRHEHERAFVECRHELRACMLPDHGTGNEGQHRDEHELPTVVEAPAEDALIIDDHEPQQRQDHTDDGKHEEHVEHHAVLRA